MRHIKQFQIPIYLIFSLVLSACLFDEVKLEQAIPAEAAFVFKSENSVSQQGENVLLRLWDLPSDQTILSIPQSATPDVWNLLHLTTTPADFAQQFEAKFQGKVRITRFEGIEIFQLSQPQMSFARHKGILMIAKHAMQVEAAIQQLKEGGNKLDFSNNKETNFAFLPHNTPTFLRTLTTSSFRSSLQFTESLTNWESGDFEQKDGCFQLQLSLSQSFPFLFESPRSDEAILSVLPDQTTAYFWGNLQGMYDSFEERLVQLGSRKLSRECFGQEFVLAASSKREQDGQILILELSQVGRKALMDLKNSGIWRAEQHLLFEFYTNGKQDFFTFGDRYLYVFKSKSSLQNWVNKYSTGQVLKNNVPFLQSRYQFPKQQRAFAYLKMKRLPNLSASILKENAQSSLPEILTDRLLAQDVWVSFNEDSLHLKLAQSLTAPVYTRASSAAPIELYDKAAIPPTVLTWQAKNYLLIQDEAHRLYLFTDALELLWTKELEGKILSDINLLKDGSLIFNTAYQVHCYDLAGNTQKAFPLELRNTTDLGICLIDFTQTGEYCYLVAGQNGAIYGYDLYGNPLAGWTPKDSLGETIHQIQHFQNAARDFIVVAADSSVYAFDRLGNIRFSYTDSLLLGTQMHYQTDSEYPRIVVPDSLGYIHIVNLEGANFKLNTGQGSAPTCFQFEDIWGDERKDYWFLQDRKLSVFAYEDKAFENRLALYFESTPDHLFPVFYKNQTWVAATFQDRKRIELYDAKGNLHPAFPLAGELPFVLHNNTIYASEGKLLYRYFLD
ncbi:MAG: hypothetical protein AAF849_04085 [Bacteroidota bacterium]